MKTIFVIVYWKDEAIICIESETKMREEGKIRAEGRQYVCHDGDVFHFLLSKK